MCTIIERVGAQFVVALLTYRDMSFRHLYSPYDSLCVRSLRFGSQFVVVLLTVTCSVTSIYRMMGTSVYSLSFGAQFLVIFLAVPCHFVFVYPQ